MRGTHIPAKRSNGNKADDNQLFHGLEALAFFLAKASCFLAHNVRALIFDLGHFRGVHTELIILWHLFSNWVFKLEKIA